MIEVLEPCDIEAIGQVFSKIIDGEIDRQNAIHEALSCDIKEIKKDVVSCKTDISFLKGKLETAASSLHCDSSIDLIEKLDSSNKKFSLKVILAVIGIVATVTGFMVTYGKDIITIAITGHP